MVQLVAGDILLSKSDVIAHAMSPEETFSSGFARALKNKWPAIAADFQRHRARNAVLPGSLWVWKAPGGQQIVGLITHEVAQPATAKQGVPGHTPGKATPAYVDHALVGLRNLVQRRKVRSVSLTRLATGSGALPWIDVETFIHEHFMDLRIPVMLYDRHRRGVKA